MSGEGTVANYSFLDDDSIATYYLTLGSTGNNSGYVEDLKPGIFRARYEFGTCRKASTRLKAVSQSFGIADK